MGTTYQVILLDEYNWDYQNTTKEKVIDEINSFLKDQGYGGAVETDFYKGIVVNTEKQSPLYGELNKFLLTKCDHAYYNCDTNICLMALTEDVERE